MRDVDDPRLGRDAQNHAFHGPDVMVGEAEIGGQGEDGLGMLLN